MSRVTLVNCKQTNLSVSNHKTSKTSCATLEWCIQFWRRQSGVNGDCAKSTDVALSSVSVTCCVTDVSWRSLAVHLYSEMRRLWRQHCEDSRRHLADRCPSCWRSCGTVSRAGTWSTKFHCVYMKWADEYQRRHVVKMTASCCGFLFWCSVVALQHHQTTQSLQNNTSQTAG